MAWQELQGAWCNAPWNKHLVVVTWAGQPILETFSSFLALIYTIFCGWIALFWGGWMTFFFGVGWLILWSSNGIFDAKTFQGLGSLTLKIHSGPGKLCYYNCYVNKSSPLRDVGCAGCMSAWEGNPFLLCICFCMFPFFLNVAGQPCLPSAPRASLQWVPWLGESGGFVQDGEAPPRV